MRRAFDDESEQVGLLFASRAAVAFSDARKLDHLGEAMSPRDRSGRPRDPDAALLGRRCRGVPGPGAVSQQGHAKLRDVAAELVTTRRLDALRGPARSGTDDDVAAPVLAKSFEAR